MKTTEPNRRQFMAASVAAIIAPALPCMSQPLDKVALGSPRSEVYEVTAAFEFGTPPTAGHPLMRGLVCRWKVLPQFCSGAHKPCTLTAIHPIKPK